MLLDGFLGAVSIANLAAHRGVILAEQIHLNLLLVNDASECVDYSLKFGD